MSRKLMVAVLVIGIALIATPLVIGLPDKADGGQEMIDAFAPLMDPDNVQKTADYYNDVFVPLGDVVPAMTQENIDRFNAYLSGFGGMGADAQNLVPALMAATGMTEAQVQQYLGGEFPAMSQMLQGLPQMQEDFTGLMGLMESNVPIFEQVPAGLDHYKPLVDTMQGQQGNYDKISALPDFRLFTWFFVVPGVLLVALALLGLRGRPDERDVDVVPGRHAGAHIDDDEMDARLRELTGTGR